MDLLVVAVGALEGECGLFRRNGVFCGGSRNVLEGSQGDVVCPAVQRRSPCGCDDAGGDLAIRKLLQSQFHFTEGNADMGSLANTTNQIRKLTTNRAVVKNRKWNVFRSVNNSKILWDPSIKPKGLFGGHLNVRSLMSKNEQIRHLLMDSNLDF